MLIVETGAGLSNADSYISLVDARAYALNYGYSLPADDTEAEVALRKGAVYAGLQEAFFDGQRLKDDQALTFPRLNSFKCYGTAKIEIPSDAVPTEAKNAQVIAAHHYAAGVAVRGNNDGLSVASKEVVGAVKKSFFDTGKNGSTITITESDDAITPLLCKMQSGFLGKTTRV